MQKAVFITGAAQGTGYAIAEAFAKEGWNVFITSRTAHKAEIAAASIQKTYGVFAKGYECNIGNEDEIKEIFDRIDQTGCFVEALILNAANLGFDPKDPAAGQDFWTVPIEEVSKVFETNLIWNFNIVRQAALRMREKGKGSIVFIGSNTALRPIPNRTAYCASKGGINSLSGALSVDLGPFGIRSNVVMPGTIKTDRWKKMNQNTTITGSLPPLGDISDFEDIANAAFFLGTDLSKNITGSELVIDGGMSRQLSPRE